MSNNSLQEFTLSIWPISRSVRKLLIMLAISFYTFGLTGVGAILMMYSMSYIAFARDSAATHGISARNSSRLGGVSILITFSVFVLLMTYLSPYTPGVLREDLWGYFWGSVMACCVLGLIEDLRADYLSPALRLALKFLVFGYFLWVAPIMVPSQIGVPGVDSLLQIPWLAWALCTVFCVGFIN